MKQKPLVSILVPVHNAAPHIEECLRSIKKQTFKNFEIVAIDDASTDNSYFILKKFKQREKRLRIYKNVKRYGIAVTMNRLLDRAKGNYIAFASTKDVFTKDKLKQQLEYLNKNSQVVAVGTQCLFINEQGKKMGRSSYPLLNDEIVQNPLHGISMQFETVMVNKNKLPKDVLKFDVNSHPFLYSDILVKLTPYGKFANLKNAFYYHRRNPEDYLLDLKKNILSLIKFFVRSKTLHNFDSSITSFFSPLLRT